MKSMTRRFAVVEACESRVLFAYDIQFLGASALRGTYSPGQTVSSQIQFRNVGDTVSPATAFIVYLAKPGFFDDTGDGDGDPSLYGGVLYADDGSGSFNGITLPSLQPGETRTLSVDAPMSSAVFNGGPYNLFVYTGVNDSSFFINDANPSDNFGLGTTADVTVTGGLDNGFPDGGNGGTATPVVGGFDTSFGGNGTGVQTSTLFGESLRTIATVFDPGLGTQYALAQRTRDGATDIVVLRFDTFGNLDTTYGGDGTAEVDLGGSSANAASLLWLGNGQVAVGGSVSDGSAGIVSVLTPDGFADASFGNAGLALIQSSTVFGAGAFTATSLTRFNGSYFLAGGLGGDFAVAKLTAVGSLDTSFGGDGGVTLDLGGIDLAGAVAVTSKGQIILGGGTTTGDLSTAIAVRLNPNGTQDLKFGTKGLLSIRARGGASEQITVAGVGAKDLIYLGGYSALGAAPSTTSQVFVARVASNGKLDKKWSGGGASNGVSLLSQLPRSLATPNTLNVTPDSGVLLSVQTADSLSGAAEGALGSALVRLDATGKGALNFGTSGIKEVLAPGITLAAAPDTDGAFQEFLANREGAATQIPGGKVRTIASQSGDGSTTLQVAQLFADGADVAPVFDGALPTSVQGGSKGTVKFRVSNLGTLDAVGNAAWSLSLVPVGTAPPVSSTLGAGSVKFKLKPGASAKSQAKILFPASANGLYAMVATLTPSSQVNDLGSGNNSVAGPNQLTVAPKKSELALVNAILSGPLTPSRVLAVTLSLLNSGNNKASGKAVLQLFLVSGDNEPDAAASPLATANVSLGTNPGSTQNLKASFKIPADLIAEPGQRLFFRLLLPDTLGDTNPSDDSLFSDVLVG